jgi:hypothetical protein
MPQNPDDDTSHTELQLVQTAVLLEVTFVALEASGSGSEGKTRLYGLYFIETLTDSVPQPWHGASGPCLHQGGGKEAHERSLRASCSILPLSRGLEARATALVPCLGLRYTDPISVLWGSSISTRKSVFFLIDIGGALCYGKISRRWFF